MAPKRPARQTRAERRAERRRPPVATAPPPGSPWRSVRRLIPVVWAVLTIVFLYYTFQSIEHRITWYLAVDQFGYLRFAHDLLAGRIHHDWPPARALASVLPERTDVLVQTYIWDHGRIYSRYAPGFPIILAAWIGLFGDDAGHLLNPTIFLVLLALLMTIQWRLCRSLWRGSIVAALVVLCPTLVHLWALTPTRDLSAHCCAFAGLAVLTGRGALGRGALLGAGLALGFAGSVRPDAVLYLIPASILALGRWWPDRSFATLRRWTAAGALGVALGLAPSLAFYWVATGNPFVPTQAVELKRFFLPDDAGAAQPEIPGVRVGYPPGWRGGVTEDVQGGGLRLSNLRTTLPGNLERVRQSYGALVLTLVGVGAVVGLLVRPVFTGAFLAYLAVAIPFFSCWTRPDHRYLIGVWLVVPMLATEGMFGPLDLIRRLVRRQAVEQARVLAGVMAALVVFVVATTATPSEATALPTLSLWLTGLLFVTFVVTAVLPLRRVAMIAAPAIATVVVGLSVTRSGASLETRASFQRPQAKRAAATFRSAVEPGAVVITTEDVGRPMENIEYYAGIDSFYFTDLKRWRLTLDRISTPLILRHFKPYVLVPASQKHLAQVAPPLVSELVAHIPPDRNYDYFVAAAFHRGLPMQLYRIRWPALEAAIQHYEQQTGRSLDRTDRTP